MYDDARQSKLKELRRLMVEEELLDINGRIDTAKLEEALEQATEGAMEEGGELGMEAAEEGEEMEAEEDPLAVARRKFFKPERKPERSPGTAVMIAMQSKKPMDKKMGKGGKA
jgi:hypothetical protein